MDLISQFNTVLNIIRSNESDISPLTDFINRLGKHKDKASFFQYIQKESAVSNNERKQRQYEQNVNTLTEYPYVFCKKFPAFEELKRGVLQVNGQWLLLFDYKKQAITALQFNSPHENRYFFGNLVNPLLIEGETSQKNLKYLMDNVRLSEDFAGDNHIYLYYKDADIFYSLMQYMDWKGFLKAKQFVFLIGQASVHLYPLDFKKEFDIDYSAMTPKQLQLNEIKRLCFYANRPFSGTALTLTPLSVNTNVEYAFEYDFHQYSTVRSEEFIKSSVFAGVLLRSKKKYTLKQIKAFLKEPGNSICLTDLKQLVREAEREISEDQPMSVIEIFKLIFLLRFRRKNKNLRVVPLIVLDVHMLSLANAYTNIIKEFEYLTILTCMRDPIRAFVSGYERGVFDQKSMFRHVLASEYSYTDMVDKQFYDRYYAYRFEDLKQYPKDTIVSMCHLLNLPYEPEMLQADWPMEDARGKIIRKSDLTPLFRDISHLINDYDLKRLRLLYKDIDEHYGYLNMLTDVYCHDEEIKALWEEQPFLFEEKYPEYYGSYSDAPDAQTLRTWILETLKDSLDKKKKRKLNMPYVIIIKNVQFEEGLDW